jgi:hypothetical protein
MGVLNPNFVIRGLQAIDFDAPGPLRSETHPYKPASRLNICDFSALLFCGQNGEQWQTLVCR